MKIIHIITEKSVKRTEKELKEAYERESKETGTHLYVSPYKQVSLKEPTYIVEMTSQELQLVSFYLELEKRKPIVNVKLESKLKKENKK